jgi:hypothetical protein
MSTEYILHDKDDYVFSADERSNVFDLFIHCRFDQTNDGVVRSVTPEELVTIATEMLKVASYWCSEDDMMKHVIDACKDSSYKKDLLASMKDYF